MQGRGDLQWNELILRALETKKLGSIHNERNERIQWKERGYLHTRARRTLTRMMEAAELSICFQSLSLRTNVCGRARFYVCWLCVSMEWSCSFIPRCLVRTNISKEAGWSLISFLLNRKAYSSRCLTHLSLSINRWFYSLILNRAFTTYMRMKKRLYSRKWRKKLALSQKKEVHQQQNKNKKFLYHSP